MAETFIFLAAWIGVVYYLYWFWKNDDGQRGWGRKKHTFGQQQAEDEEASR